MNWRAGLFLLATCTSSIGMAHQASLLFDARSLKESGSLILNLDRRALHPPLHIHEYNVSGLANRDMDVGDGRHGAFVRETYHLFSQGGDLSGQIIRLPLADFSPLQVTEFHLEAGWTLEPVGDSPLQIYSQGHVLIEGIINCSGHDGSPGVLGAGTQTTDGGSGRCGGAAGGKGGAVSIIAEAGYDTVPALVTGGEGGHHSIGTGAGGGGGGGSYHSVTIGLGAAQAGENGGGVVGGAPGLSDDSLPAVAYSDLTGGAGGGGGGFHANSSGGGGGGGGGVVVIHSAGSVHVTTTGKVLAEGGLGGAGVNDGGFLSGTGGGGGGGTILIASIQQVPPSVPLDPQRFNLFEGLVSAKEIVGVGNWGAGGAGRTWVATSTSGDPFGYFGLDPEPFTFRVHQGDVEYKTGTFDFVSKPMSLAARKPIFSSVTLVGVENAGNGTIEVKVRGAATTAELSAQPFELVENAPSPEGMKYFQVQVTINNASGTQPVTLQGVQVNFDLGDIFQYDYVGQCSQVAPMGMGGPGMGLFWLMMMFSPILILRLLLRRRPLVIKAQ